MKLASKILFLTILLIICTFHIDCQAIPKNFLPESVDSDKTSSRSSFFSDYMDKYRLIKSKIKKESEQERQSQIESRKSFKTVKSKYKFISQDKSDSRREIIIFEDYVIERSLKGLLTTEQAIAEAEYKKAEEKAFLASLESMNETEKAAAIAARQEEERSSFDRKVTALDYFIYQKPRNGVYHLVNGFSFESYAGRIVKIIKNLRSDSLIVNDNFFPSEESANCSRQRINFIWNYYILKNNIRADVYQLKLSPDYYPQEVQLLIYNESNFAKDSQKNEFLLSDNLKAIFISERREVNCLSHQAYSFVPKSKASSYFFSLGKNPLIEPTSKSNEGLKIISINPKTLNLESYNINLLSKRDMDNLAYVMYPPIENFDFTINLKKVKTISNKVNAKTTTIRQSGLVGVILSQ